MDTCRRGVRCRELRPMEACPMEHPLYNFPFMIAYRLLIGPSSFGRNVGCTANPAEPSAFNGSSDRRHTSRQDTPFRSSRRCPDQGAIALQQNGLYFPHRTITYLFDASHGRMRTFISNWIKDSRHGWSRLDCSESAYPDFRHGRYQGRVQDQVPYLSWARQPL